MTASVFPVTGNPQMDALLESDPFARLLGMMLDQQITMEKAFAAPYMLRDRLDGTLDVAAIAAWDPDDFDARFRIKPALHRFPGAMAKRTQKLASVIVEEYGGDTERLWEEAGSGQELFDRLCALPGFGEEKSRIFVAVLAKRFAITPRGWKKVAGVFAQDTPRSVADIDSAEGLARVRAWKKAQKAKGLTKAD